MAQSGRENRPTWFDSTAIRLIDKNRLTRLTVYVLAWLFRACIRCGQPIPKRSWGGICAFCIVHAAFRRAGLRATVVRSKPR